MRVACMVVQASTGRLCPLPFCWPASRQAGHAVQTTCIPTYPAQRESLDVIARIGFATEFGAIKAYRPPDPGSTADAAGTTGTLGPQQGGDGSIAGGGAIDTENIFGVLTRAEAEVVARLANPARFLLRRIAPVSRPAAARTLCCTASRDWRHLLAACSCSPLTTAASRTLVAAVPCACFYPQRTHTPSPHTRQPPPCPWFLWFPTHHAFLYRPVGPASGTSARTRRACGRCWRASRRGARPRRGIPPSRPTCYACATPTQVGARTATAAAAPAFQLPSSCPTGRLLFRRWLGSDARLRPCLAGTPLSDEQLAAEIGLFFFAGGESTGEPLCPSRGMPLHQRGRGWGHPCRTGACRTAGKLGAVLADAVVALRSPSGHTMAWALMLLAQHPEAEEKVGAWKHLRIPFPHLLTFLKPAPSLFPPTHTRSHTHHPSPPGVC
jgi:hypothetical protein